MSHPLLCQIDSSVLPAKLIPIAIFLCLMSQLWQPQSTKSSQPQPWSLIHHLYSFLCPQITNSCWFYLTIYLFSPFFLPHSLPCFKSLLSFVWLIASPSKLQTTVISLCNTLIMNSFQYMWVQNKKYNKSPQHLI